MTEPMSQSQPQNKRRYATIQDEIVDRVRRIETRLTKYLEWKGFDTQVARATWTGSHVAIPSPAISLQEILNAVPGQHPGPVIVCIGDDHIVTLQRSVI